MAELHVIGQVLGGSGFQSHNLFCKVTLLCSRLALDVLACSVPNDSGRATMRCSGAFLLGGHGSCWRAWRRDRRS